MVGLQPFSKDFEFMETLGIERPCIVDDDSELYESYGRLPKEDSSIVAPLHVVIDRQGVITHYSQESDFALIGSAIESALAKDL